MDVDPVEQRPGDLAHVFLHLRSRALTGPPRIATVATWAGIERRHEHEVGGEAGGGPRAADRDRAFLERLPHHLQRAPLKLREFVEKQHAVVRQRDFSGHRNRAAADEPGFGDRVVGGAKRPRGHQRLAGLHQAQRAVDPRGLDRLGCRKRRQDRGDPLGEHRLAATGRADHRDVVAAGSRHADRPLRRLLAADVGEVDVVGRKPVEPLVHAGRGGRNLEFAREEPHGFAE